MFACIHPTKYAFSTKFTVSCVLFVGLGSLKNMLRNRNSR